MRSAGPVPPEPTSRLGPVATFKPAYLIHGDDHGRIAERRAPLRAIAEAEAGTGGVELFEGDAATPGAGAPGLRPMTLAVGGGLLVVRGGERGEGAEGGSGVGPAP